MPETIKESLNFTYSIPIEEKGVFNSDFIIAGTAINATITSNNHKFLPEVLQQSANSLIGVPLLVDHENKVENIKGRVVYAGYDNVGQKIPFKAKVMDPKIQEMIKDGRLNSVSVGATVNPKDIEEGEDGCIIPHNITFKELSLVAVPADHNATFQVAMNQAYKASKIEIKTEPVEIKVEQKIEPIVTNDNHNSERRLEMSEQIETKVEQKLEVKEAVKDNSMELLSAIKSMGEQLNAMNAKIASMEKSKVQEKAVQVEEAEEIEETATADYKIVQGFGDLKGGAFSYVRNNYR